MGTRCMVKPQRSIDSSGGNGLIIGGLGTHILTDHDFDHIFRDLAVAEFMITLSNFNGFAAYENPVNVPPNILLDG